MLVHDGQVAAVPMGTSNVKELVAVEVEVGKGALPIFGEIMLGQPVEDSIQWPLGTKVTRRNGSIRNGLELAPRRVGPGRLGIRHGGGWRARRCVASKVPAREGNLTGRSLRQLAISLTASIAGCRVNGRGECSSRSSRSAAVVG
jgi:hypothetical protein